MRCDTLITFSYAVFKWRKYLFITGKKPRCWTNAWKITIIYALIIYALQQRNMKFKNINRERVEKKKFSLARNYPLRPVCIWFPLSIPVLRLYARSLQKISIQNTEFDLLSIIDRWVVLILDKHFDGHTKLLKGVVY